ncbi:Cyclin-like [Sesbania bispinosa]|nr:Cyclin-like [Sesbania bispinosa]
MLCFDHHSKLVSQIHNEQTFDWGDYEYDDDHHVIYSLHECRTSEGYKKLDVDADHMRRNIIDCLIATHYGLELRPETLYLCVNILDRFLCKTKFDKSTTKKELVLVAVTSLLLASKYEQQGSLSVSALEYITQNSCSQDDIRRMEIVILSKLNWVLTVPTPYVFLPRYMRACLLYDDDMDMNMIMENMALEGVQNTLQLEFEYDP